VTGYLILLGPFSAAIVYTTAKVTIIITIAKANSFSIVSPIKRSQPADIQQTRTADGKKGKGVDSRRLLRSKQIKQIRSVRIAL